MSNKVTPYASEDMHCIELLNIRIQLVSGRSVLSIYYMYYFGYFSTG